ncbi:FAD-dependent oxidoreductase [Chitinophagaceae bacterium IBVUCB1]|nr:FAD-dependent oxidoreductase [Chitinophagaceae bacterium IBVUCB1]
MATSANRQSDSSSRLIILGAGFAGLQLAKKLRNSGYHITLIDQYNYHQFQPLFYQVATARLEPSSISFPLRKIFQRSKNVRVRNTKVREVNTAEQKVVTEDGVFQYDVLVIATGCTTNFFGNKNLEQYAYPMKSTTEAITLRNRILLNFEDALNAAPDALEEIMNIVVVGGGPTGVELSGSLAELKKNILPRDYPDMDFSKLNVYLLEGSPNTLSAMSAASQHTSQTYLENMGVQVWVNAVVQDYDGHTVVLKDGRQIKTRNLIWAAGITGNVPAGISKEVLARGNRIKVDQCNRVVGMQNVYAIGDIAYMETPEWPNGHPQMANVAGKQATHLATNLQAIKNGNKTKQFRYKLPGTMATVGKRKAVVDLPFISFQGVVAWLFWMFLHLMLILNAKNKLIIFINWAISYFTNDTTLRLILMPTRKQVEMAKQHHSIEE